MPPRSLPGYGVAALFLLPLAAQANRYTIVDLGKSTFPTAVNTSRNVAGSMGRGNRQAAVWRGGHWHPLGGAYANGINGRGDVVGMLEGHPEIWPRREQRHAVDLPPGNQGGQANGIAQDRTLVGSYDIATDQNHYRCFMTDPQGHTIDLGLIGSGTECVALDVNGAHQVVGYASVSLGSYLQAFLWQDGRFMPLGVLPGGHSSQAQSINKHGDVVGSGTTSAPTGSHAILWRQGEMRDIGADAKYSSSTALAISDAGDIVGYATAASDLSEHAVRFADGRIIDLAGEVEDLEDWQLGQAWSVSNEGVIVGQGSRDDPQGRHEHGFMLVPLD